MKKTYRFTSLLVAAMGLFVLGQAQTKPQKETAARERAEARRESKGGEKLNLEKMEEEGGLAKSRKDAYDYWYEQRAHGVGFIDRDAYMRAIKYRDTTMAPGKIGGSGVGTGSLRAAATTGTWQFLGPNNLGGGSGDPTTPYAGRVNAIAYMPGSSTSYYVATSSGGIWKTTDGGTNFIPLSDSWPTMYSSSVAVSPSSGNVVYAGGGDFDGDYSVNGQGLSCGLMKSTDGGATWTQLGVAQGFANYDISDIIVDPENPSIVTIAEGKGKLGSGFVWRSTDAGSTWTKVITTASVWSDLAVTASSGGVRYYYAVSLGGLLYRSADRGATWTALASPAGNGFYHTRIATHPSNQAFAYILDANNSRIWKTGTTGASWIDVTNNLAPSPTGIADWGQSWYDAFIAVGTSGGQDVVYVGMTDLYASVNGGASWVNIGQVYGVSPKLHPDMHYLAFDPTVPNVQGVIGCDGGVYSFNFNPSTLALACASKNATLGITELYNIDIHPTNINTVLGGAQDNSTDYSQGGNISTWQLEIGGDGGYCAINPANAANMYGSYVFGALFRTDNDWLSFSQIQGQSNGTAFLAPFILDPNNPNILYSGAGFGLNKYDHSTSTWANHLGGQNLTSSYLLSIAVAPSNSSRIYTGGEDGQVWMSTNGGATWMQINAGSTSLPNRAVTGISVNPTNPDDIIVTLSGTGTAHLYQCLNPSSATRNWTSVSGGVQTLPDLPANAVVRDPINPNTAWYVGTDAGVMQTVDGGASWQNFTGPAGLPNVQVNTLKIRASDRYMYAGTWGRGVWRIQLPAPSVVKSISANPTTIPSGSTIAGTVTLWQAAPSGGITVNLSSNNAAATVPATVTVLQGATTANFNILTSNATYANIAATITETLASDPNHTVNVTVMPANYSQFIGQTVPTSMIAGQTYSVALQFKNTGSTTWTTGNTYKLMSVSPSNNTIWGVSRIALVNGPVAPGGTGTFMQNVIAPASSGTYTFQWRMIQETCGAFGPSSNARSVPVTKVADAARYLSKTGAVTVNAGADFYVQNTMLNVGTATWTSAAGYAMSSLYDNWNSPKMYLPTSVAPGAQVTYTKFATAPIVPGTYQMQWQSSHGATLFGDKTPLINMTVVQGPINAKFISQTMNPGPTAIPISMGPGTTYPVTFTMQNLGTSTWDSTYSLVSIGGNNFGVASIPVTGSIIQNSNATFNATLTAPATPGTYTLQFRMQNAGGTKFGQATTSLTIVVSADAAQYISKTGGVTVNAGADFYVQYTMKNTGTTTWSTASSYWLRSINPTDNTTWGRNRIYLPGSGSVAPGASVTYTGLLTAPTTPGSTYVQQWQSNHSSLFGEKTPALTINVVQGPDNAIYQSQTGIPTTIVHGTTFNATVTMQNTGTATWDGTYSLVPIGNNTWGVAAIAATSTAPNATKAFNATFTAPATPGTYTFQMRMAHSGTKFGGTSLLVTITVT